MVPQSATGAEADHAFLKGETAQVAANCNRGRLLLVGPVAGLTAPSSHPTALTGSPPGARVAEINHAVQNRRNTPTSTRGTRPLLSPN